MSKVIALNGYGDPSALQVKDVLDDAPRAGQVLIRQHAVGINSIDVLCRKGKLPDVASDSEILGFEASGEIIEVGNGVKGLKVGDKVVYATAPVGAYREMRCVDAMYVIKAPNSISYKTLSAHFLKGLVAHSLLKRAFMVNESSTILVHDITIDSGPIISQFAISLGAKVIATVSNPSHIEFAKELGCSAVFDINTKWQQNIMDFTSGIGCNAVYSSIGESIVLQQSLEVLMKFGAMVQYNHSANFIGDVNFLNITKNSVFITNVSLLDYKSNRAELLLSASDVFEFLMSESADKIQHTEYLMNDVSIAHADLESKKIIGPAIFVI